MRLSIGNLQKKILVGPQNALKSVFKVSQPVQAGLLLFWKHTFPTPFGVPAKKIFFRLLTEAN